jgi:hypothetical protein
VKELTRWWSETAGAEASWLILGKGPSLARAEVLDLSGFRTLALNHAARERPVDVASVIDIEVLTECGDAIARNAGTLLVPRHPHVGTNPSPRPLEAFFSELPCLERLSREDRLVWYDFETGPRQVDTPRIPQGHFSGEVVVSLLARLGARRIRTLGMDGGARYAPHFDDVSQATLLANGQSSFDVQWQGIASTVREHGVDFAPLESEVPIRVYVGSDETQLLAAQVLEFSIRRLCPAPVEFDTMLDVKAPVPRDPRNQPRTEFSFNRFAIPERAGYEGRALYLDADMLVLRNLLELWDIPCDGGTVLHARSPNPRWPKQLSVLKLDCERLDWRLPDIIRDLDGGAYDYAELMTELCIEAPDRVRPTLPPEWNSLELHEPGRTGLIHYTNMVRQPWVSCRNPNGDLWVDMLREAIEEGFVSEKELREAVERGYVRPSLPLQLRFPRRLWGLFRATLGPLVDIRFRPHRALRERLRAGRKAEADRAG